MKKILMMALVAVTILSSCSQQEEIIDNNNAGKVSLAVKVDLSKFTATRSGDASITTPPEWDQILFVVTDKNDADVPLAKARYTKDDLTTLSNKVTLIEKTPDGADLNGGKVKVYLTTTGNDWNELSPSNKPHLAADQTDINNWQLSGLITAGIGGKFVNVPYYGQAPIDPKGVNTDGHELLEANISATPELGRLQVLNSPMLGGVKGDFTVSSLSVSNVYINKIASTAGTVDIRTENGNVNVNSATWKAEFYAPTKRLAGMWDNATNKGYQIFDGNKPHVIVEVKYKLTKDGQAEGAEEYTGYLTIQKFTYTDVTSVTKGDLTVLKGKIYNIDLSVLQPAYDHIGDDPYDNTVYYDLIANVTVNPWNPVSVTPEL